MLELYTLKISDCVGENNIEELYNMTSSITQDKVSRYRFIEDKKRTLYADLLVRSIIIRLTGVNNRGIRFITNQYGKPYYVENNNLFFNISHSGDRVLCGFSNEEIGVDIELMKKASLIFIGTHDFTSFNASPLDEYPDQVRCIYDIRFSMENDLLRISFIGEGFLRYMVRMLTGCLLEVGKHHMSISDVKKILDAKDKKIFRHNVIGNGLYLMHIDYFKMFYDGNNFIIRE